MPFSNPLGQFSTQRLYPPNPSPQQVASYGSDVYQTQPPVAGYPQIDSFSGGPGTYTYAISPSQIMVSPQALQEASAPALPVLDPIVEQRKHDAFTSLGKPWREYNVTNNADFYAITRERSARAYVKILRQQLLKLKKTLNDPVARQQAQRLANQLDIIRYTSKHKCKSRSQAHANISGLASAVSALNKEVEKLREDPQGIAFSPTAIVHFLANLASRLATQSKVSGEPGLIPWASYLCDPYGVERSEAKAEACALNTLYWKACSPSTFDAAKNLAHALKNLAPALDSSIAATTLSLATTLDLLASQPPERENAAKLKNELALLAKTLRSLCAY